MRTPARLRRLVTSLAIAAAVAVPCAAAAAERTLEIEVHGRHGNANLSFTMNGTLLLSWLDALAPKWMHCRTSDDDADVVAAIEALDRSGEGTTYRFHDDGKRIYARRDRGQLDLVVEERRLARAEISVPWSFAACMRGEDVTFGDLVGQLKSGEPIEIRATGADGSTVRLRLK